jgi:hypothetical protein
LQNGGHPDDARRDIIELDQIRQLSIACNRERRWIHDLVRKPVSPGSGQGQALAEEIMR